MGTSYFRVSPWLLDVSLIPKVGRGNYVPHIVQSQGLLRPETMELGFHRELASSASA